MAEKMNPGAVIEVAHPFVLEEVDVPDVDGIATIKSWRPGIRYESRPFLHDAGLSSSWAVADGVGAQRLTVVSIHRPGRFPTRVFYTREWQDPTGKWFGHPRLLTKTLGSFRALIRGYRHEYEMAALSPPTPKAGR